MKQLLLALILCAITAPAFAQDDPIYAPCLLQFPAPEEFLAMEDQIAAMEGAGWTHRTWDIMRNRAAPPLAEIEHVASTFPSAFRNAAEAQAFADRAMYIYEQSMEFVEVFTRDGVSASVTSAEFGTGVIGVRCTFAGLSVPDVAQIFAEDENSRDDLAFTMGWIEPSLPDNAIDLTVTALRFDGDEAVLAPLTGREGLMVSYDYQVSE